MSRIHTMYDGATYFIEKTSDEGGDGCSSVCHKVWKRTDREGFQRNNSSNSGS